jgi:hypothetical protein
MHGVGHFRDEMFGPLYKHLKTFLSENFHKYKENCTDLKTVSEKGAENQHMFLRPIFASSSTKSKFCTVCGSATPNNKFKKCSR